jgi:hypothetical protein
MVNRPSLRPPLPEHGVESAKSILDILRKRGLPDTNRIDVSQGIRNDFSRSGHSSVLLKRKAPD